MSAPAPTVCESCDGSRLETVAVIGHGRYGREIQEELTGRPCPDCCCSTCGEPTSTPPLCERHQRELDDEKAAKAWREGRYE